MIKKDKIKERKFSKFNCGKPDYLMDRRLYKIKEWRNALRGQPAFILGNGPGILDYDMAILDSFFTIGINRIFDIFDPTILFWQDIELWNDHWKKIIKLDAIKVAEEDADPEKICVNFRRLRKKPYLSGFPGLVSGLGNSGLLAVQFAFALGCDPLILIGMDCNYRDNNTDFYGRNKYHKTKTLDWCKRSLRWMKNNEKLNIINCSDNDYWPKCDLNEIVKRYKNKGLGKNLYKRIFRGLAFISIKDPIQSGPYKFKRINNCKTKRQKRNRY